MKRAPAQLYITVKPDDAWRSDFIGQLLRRRGRGTMTLLGAAIILLMLHYHQSFAAGFVTALTVFFSLGLTVAARQRRHRWRTAEFLHQFFHETRDDVARLLAGASTCTDTADEMTKFHQRSVERIAWLFRVMISDSTINCALRLAELVDGKQVYVTRARSSGLATSRAASSEPLPADQGLPKAMMSRGAVGVVIINSIAAATDAGWWMKSQNDDLSDVKTLMVTPINGWEHGQKVMLGILYITSIQGKFAPIYTLPLKALADALGLVYPIIMGSINSVPSGENRPKGTSNVE